MAVKRKKRSSITVQDIESDQPSSEGKLENERASKRMTRFTPLLREALQSDKELSDRVFDIDMKLVYIAAGSSSLSLTFLGILYQGERDVSGLSFNFIMLAVVSLANLYHDFISSTPIIEQV